MPLDSLYHPATTVRDAAATQSRDLATVAEHLAAGLGMEPSSLGYRPGAMTTLPPTRALFAGLLVGFAIVSCNGPSATATGAPDTGIGGVATAGPVCPVERNPPDPNCAPRPVAGATIVIRDGSGSQVAAAISGADGSYFVALPPGDYVVDPQPVSGLLGTATEQQAAVAAGAVTDVPLDYDTGIR